VVDVRLTPLGALVVVPADDLARKVAAAVDDQLTISMMVFMDQVRPDVIIHTDAQPSPFIHMSTNILEEIAQHADRHAVWLERSAP
jgi:hypothetical protein